MTPKYFGAFFEGKFYKKSYKNNTMTAVEYLEENLKMILPQSQYNDVLVQNVIEKSKEMEKEQMIDAFWNGDNTDCLSEQNLFEFADKYYNQTYKKTTP